METDNTPEKKKKLRSARMVIIIGSCTAAIVLLVLLALYLFSGGNLPQYAENAEKTVDQMERKVKKNAAPMDLDATVSALYSMEQALQKARNFEELTEYVVQDSSERVAPEVQMLKYRMFRVYKELLSDRDSREQEDSLYKAAGGVLTDFVSTFDASSALFVNRVQAERVWKKHVEQAGIDRTLRRRIAHNERQLMDFMFEYQTIAGKYLREWEKLCALRDRAYLGMVAGDQNETIANAAAAVAMAPYEKEAHTLLAMALLERGGELDLSTSSTVIDNLLKNHPDYAPGYLLRGVLLLKRKDFRGASHDFAQAAVYYPKNLQEVSDRIGIYKKRSYLNRSAEGRVIVNSYRAMMSGSGYFSPDFQQARLLMSEGKNKEAGNKVFDHFFRRRLQGEWDQVLNDFKFANRFLDTSLFMIGSAQDPRMKRDLDRVNITLEPAFFFNKIVLKVTNSGRLPLHNVTLLLCVRFTDMFKRDYVSFPVGDTIALLKPGESMTVGKSDVGRVSMESIGMKKEFKDIIEYAAVMISDEAVSWVETTPLKSMQTAKRESESVKVQDLSDKTRSMLKKAASALIDYAGDAVETKFSSRKSASQGKRTPAGSK